MINFDYLSVTFDLEILNEKNHNFEFFTLKFENIIDLKCDNLCINEESCIELTSFDYQFEDVLNGKMIFLLGEDQVSMQLDIKCKAIDFVKK